MNSDHSSRLASLGAILPLLIVLLFFVCSHMNYIHRVNPIPVHDSTAYITKADRIYQLFDSQRLPKAMTGLLRVEQRFRPPFHPLRALLLDVNSPGIFSRILISNIAIFLLIAWMLCYLEKQIVNGPIMGLSVLLWISFPITIQQATAFFSELTLTPIVLLYYIMLFNPLRHIWMNGIAWGFLTGLGCLTKLTFPAFSLIPTLWRVKSAPSAMRWKWLIGVMGTSLILALPWYVLNHAEIVANFKMNMTESPDRPCGSALSIEQFLWYLRASRNILSQMGRLLCIAGVILAFRKRNTHFWQLITSLFAGYLIFSILAHKEPRHIFAFTPLLSLLAAYGFYTFRSSLFRHAVALILAAGATLNLSTLYNAKPLFHYRDHAESLGKRIPMLDIGVKPLDQTDESHHFDQLIAVLGESAHGKSIAFGSIYGRFCGEAFFTFCRYERDIRDYSVTFYGGYVNRWAKSMSSCDYYICRSDRQTFAPDSPLFNPLELTFAAVAGQNPESSVIPSHFQQIADIPSDDGKNIWVFHRTLPCDTQEKREWMRLLKVKPLPLIQSREPVSELSR